ncbi:DUF3383 family protein [Lelliottia wanjuensis]|uniref:DUF3383 family protein n=1 Tax=Lelliottia wanjuensis TaxID=3050585 RepID=UPI00254F8CC9|nr:DUF3383 family protein [Lelliottia sp. V104_15]MDK9607109.1 DUF3383 family protein [Lelliottia sp. V104_15]
MSLSIGNVVNVIVNPPADVVSSANFGTVVLFSPAAVEVLTAPEMYRQYSTLKAFQTDFPEADTDEYFTTTAEYFFDQPKRPQYLYVAAWDAENVTKPQKLSEAYSALQQSWDGWYCACPVGAVASPADLMSASEWIQAAGKIQALTDSAASDIEPATSTLKPLIDAGLYRTLVLYMSGIADGGPSPVVSLAALLCSIDFDAENSMLTLKFKDLPGVSVDNSIDDTAASKLTTQGVNYFTTFGTKRMVAEGWMLGATMWADEVIGLDWLRNQLQVDVFNALSERNKVPLTDPGVAEIMDAADAVMKQSVRNGLVAPGAWDGDPVGAVKTGDYLENGYYIYADSVSTLSVDDRKARKCPPITILAHLGGAVHSVNIVVNTNR